MGELIFLFEWVAFWGEIVYLDLLGVNLPWLLALGCSPLREKSSGAQDYARNDARDHGEGWQLSLRGSTCSESRTCLYISSSVVVPLSWLGASLGYVGLAHRVEYQKTYCTLNFNGLSWVDLARVGPYAVQLGRQVSPGRSERGENTPWEQWSLF